MSAFCHQRPHALQQWFASFDHIIGTGEHGVVPPSLRLKTLALAALRPYLGREGRPP
jgi:hypothetical protein